MRIGFGVYIILVVGTITGRVFAERFGRASTSRGIHICKIYDAIAYFALPRQLGECGKRTSWDRKQIFLSYYQSVSNSSSLPAREVNSMHPMGRAAIRMPSTLRRLFALTSFTTGPGFLTRHRQTPGPRSISS
jgi:hypothetical protein